MARRVQVLPTAPLDWTCPAGTGLLLRRKSDGYITLADVNDGHVIFFDGTTITYGSLSFAAMDYTIVRKVKLAEVLHLEVNV